MSESLHPSAPHGLPGFELRWVITACLMLNVALITVIFYFHRPTSTATLFYRTVPILPEISGRVSEVHVEFSAPDKRGDAYTSNHELMASKETGAFRRFALHGIDAVGIAHAMLLRIQALSLPVKTLVLSGH